MEMFRVWAPGASGLEVTMGGRRIRLCAERGGWWAGAVPQASAGVDYAFLVDGGEPIPDPRSPCQPLGVHGPSRRVDPGAFVWTDLAWRPPPLASGIIYELHVGTFTPEGTFRSTIDGLDHLVRLGVTHVELMPVNTFPGRRGWGYDGVGLYAPYQPYGGPLELKRLVDACHRRGLAVILDVVYNHLGPVGNYLDRFGPYFTNRYETPWGAAFNLDGRGSDEVRRFICDNALMWLREFHFDGLRIDAVHAIFDSSAVHLLEQLAREVEELAAHLGRPLVLVAESDLNDPRLVRRPEVGGYGLDGLWNEDFHHALHALLTGERAGYYEDFGTLEDLATTLGRGWVYDGRFSRYRGRRHGRPAADLSGHRFVGFLQNHDQVGNRPRGERTSQLMSVGLLKIGAALVLMAPFVPMLFQGEEWGASTPFCYFTDHGEPELADAVRTGRRRELSAFGWHDVGMPDPQAPATFASSKLDWSEIDREPHRGVLAWHRQLVELRRREPSLRDGRMDRVVVRFDEASRWLTMTRGPIVLACNLTGESRSVPLGSGAPHDLVLSSDGPVRLQSERIGLPPESAAVVRRGLVRGGG